MRHFILKSSNPIHISLPYTGQKPQSNHHQQKISRTAVVGVCVEGSSKKEKKKGLKDTDNSVVIMGRRAVGGGGRGRGGINSNGKTTIKNY